METDSSLLNTEMDQQQQEEMYRHLIMQTMGQITEPNPDSKLIQPQPGLCVKTVSLPDKQKVFVNICQSPAVPPPPQLSKEELLKVLQSDDPTTYKVPLSLGEPHDELDNNSHGCTAYDVVINNYFFVKCQKEPLFLQFVIAVSFEGLENKYSIELSRDWKVLKNRKFLGTITNQNIRAKSKPTIQEISSTEKKAPSPAPLAAKRPGFFLLVEPAVGNPESLTAEIHLPGVPSCRSLLLDLGEDRLVLNVRPSLFHLDCFLPFSVDPEFSQSQFNRNTKILKVTMKVINS